MKTKIDNTFKFLKKLDNFSKVILIVLTVGAIFFVYQNFIPGSKGSSPSNVVKLRNPSTFKLNVASYSFNSGFRERLIIDDTLIIKLSTDLDREAFDKLVFEIKPKDDIKVEYFDERTIKVRFANKMQLNNNSNSFLILLNDELVYSIVFNNTTYTESYLENLNDGPVITE